VSEQTLTPEQRAELARLASEADLPWRAKGHWVHSNADVVAMAEDSEQGGRDVQFIVAACNAVPQLMADLAAAEQRAERAEDRAAVLTDRLNTATTDCSLLLGSLGLAEGRGSVVAAERDALRARVAELEAMLPYEEGDHA
jgi:hypothetical protein